jgi:hypothetical protein
MRSSGSFRPAKVTIGNVDLPAFVSEREVLVQAPLRLIFEAFGEDFSTFERDLEVGISEARRSALSPDGLRGSVSGENLAVKGVVRRRRQRRSIA